MSDRKAETIKIGGNTDYAKVVTRVLEMHADSGECSVETSCEFIQGVGVMFRAAVTTKKGTFTGHSFGKIGNKQKQFEKQETIAVGRALAFAGYLASGEIASYEEMSDFHSPEPPERTHITTDELKDIKLRWRNAFPNMAEKAPNLQAKRFIEWASEYAGREFDATKLAQWTRADLDACVAVLNPEEK